MGMDMDIHMVMDTEKTWAWARTRKYGHKNRHGRWNGHRHRQGNAMDTDSDKETVMDTAADMDINIPVLPKTTFQTFGWLISDDGKKFIDIWQNVGTCRQNFTLELKNLNFKHFRMWKKEV
jgi:hypothetical protein